MNYSNLYDRFINSRRDRQVNKEATYLETHHIIPRCLGGTDAQENLVSLTAREHFLAHYILTKMYPTNVKIVYAFHMMSVNAHAKGHQRTCNSRAYHKAKEALNNYVKKYGPIVKHHNVCLKNFVWLKKDGQNKKIDKTSALYLKLLNEGWVRGRVTFKRKPHTEESKEKISNANKGKQRTRGMILPTRGKTYSEIYGSERAEEQRLKRSKASTGKSYSKYVWKLVAPSGEEYTIENINVVDFFKPFAPSVKKSVYVLLSQLDKSKKPAHHGILKGWKVEKILKEVA